MDQLYLQGSVHSRHIFFIVTGATLLFLIRPAPEVLPKAEINLLLICACVPLFSLNTSNFST